MTIVARSSDVFIDATHFRVTVVLRTGIPVITVGAHILVHAARGHIACVYGTRIVIVATGADILVLTAEGRIATVRRTGVLVITRDVSPSDAQSLPTSVILRTGIPVITRKHIGFVYTPGFRDTTVRCAHISIIAYFWIQGIRTPCDFIAGICGAGIVILARGSDVFIDAANFGVTTVCRTGRVIIA